MRFVRFEGFAPPFHTPTDALMAGYQHVGHHTDHGDGCAFKGQHDTYCMTCWSQERWRHQFGIHLPRQTLTIMS